MAGSLQVDENDNLGHAAAFAEKMQATADYWVPPLLHLFDTIFVVYRRVKGNISIIFTFAFDDLPNRLNRDSKGWPMSLDFELPWIRQFGRQQLPSGRLFLSGLVGADVKVWTFWDFNFVILRFIYLLFLLIISRLRTALSCILPQVLDFETKAWDKWEVGTWAFHMS